MNSQDQIWYACYGSNILQERFLCYIQGGDPMAQRKFTMAVGTRLCLIIMKTSHAFVGVLPQRNTLAKMKFSVVSIYLYTE
jgi:hypothetical protein